MITIEQQKELLAKAFENGIETYQKAIKEQVGEYDQEEVTWILSRRDFDSMWNAYIYNDTMVRDYVMDIITEELKNKQELQSAPADGFEADYQAEQKNIQMYENAKAAGDESGMEAARAAHEELMEKIGAKGQIYCRIFREYQISMDCGNTYLDLNDVIWDRDVTELISCMKTNGIDHFTFSSAWSSAVETAWQFTQNGCKLEGLVEINGRAKKIMSDEYEKAHGYLFRIG